MQRKLFFLVYLLFVGGALSACGLFGEGETAETAVSPTISLVTPEATLSPQTTPGVIVTSATVTETLRTLIIWLPPEFSSRTETADNILSAQLLAFSSKYPDLNIKLETKTIAGAGGMRSYLRAGRNIASTILPHIIVLPVDQLALTASEGLIYPLDTLLEPTLYEDMYPAALSFSQVDGQRVGYPFALTGLSHLAYNSTVMTATLPIVWDDLRSVSGASLVFPAAGENGALLALELYLAFGGQLTNEVGQTSLQVEPLTEVLTLLQTGRNENFITIQSSNIRSLAESWQVYQAGQATITRTSSDQFLVEGVLSANTGFAPIPGPTDALVPLVSGWAWAISTPHEFERSLAAELITFLATPEELGRWSQNAQILPSRQSALLWWPATGYQQFSHGQLLRAKAVPSRVNTDLLTVLETAVFDVVSLNKTPQVAAEEAVAALQTP